MLPKIEGDLSERARNQVLETEITTLAGHINAATYRFLKLMDEFDQNEGWCGDGIRCFGHWLNWKCGIGYVEAREKVRVARALRDLPLIDEAFSKGEVSYSVVRAVTRVATPENEEFLLQIGRHGTAAHVEQLVRRYRKVKKLNEPMDEMDDWRKEKQFWSYEDEWGMCVINMKLPPEDGAVVLKAVEALVEQLREEKKQEAERDRQNVSAETFLKVEREHWEAKRTDAITLMAEHCLKTMSDGGKSGGRFEILMHVNANPEHIDYKINNGPCCHLDSGSFLAPETVRRLACDAALTTVLENDKGSVLNIGRRSRSATPAIEKAVRIRDDGCCRFPGFMSLNQLCGGRALGSFGC